MNFLRAYDTDPAVASGVISYFKEHSELQCRGGSCVGGELIVDTDIKDSTDLSVPDVNNPRIKAWLAELNRCTDRYGAEFPMMNIAAPVWGITEGINIQHYAPGQGYKSWHTEKINSRHLVYRHLVFMTFLNDIPVGCGGGTEFFHQRMTVDAKAGRTCIWPADWTYTHRGVTSHTHEKYIITGWFSYMQLDGGVARPSSDMGCAPL